MSWVNAFDAGPCTVKVWNGTDWNSEGGTPVWSGLLAKGESSPVFQGGPFSDVSTQVTVDADGTVILSYGIEFADAMSVEVVPSYSIATKNLRVRDMSVVVNASTGGAANHGDTSVTLTPTSAPAVTPDPADITSANGTAASWIVSNSDGIGGGA